VKTLCSLGHGALLCDILLSALEILLLTFLLTDRQMSQNGVFRCMVKCIRRYDRQLVTSLWS